MLSGSPTSCRHFRYPVGPLGAPAPQCSFTALNSWWRENLLPFVALLHTLHPCYSSSLDAHPRTTISNLWFTHDPSLHSASFNTDEFDLQRLCAVTSADSQVKIMSSYEDNEVGGTKVTNYITIIEDRKLNTISSQLNSLNNLKTCFLNLILEIFS